MMFVNDNLRYHCVFDILQMNLGMREQRDVMNGKQSNIKMYLAILFSIPFW